MRKNTFGFNLKHLRGDLFGGITAGIVALPLALAFGVSSGLGPSAGLYGAIIVSFFAALFGGTDTQISGPTAPMTAVSMIIITEILASFDGDINKALPIILMVFLLAGLIQILLGVIGIGKYIKYIPYPVVSGFMTAIGVIIILTQILPAIGYYAKDDLAYVNKYKPQAEEIILHNILIEEAGEDILVLEDFEETIRRAAKINEAQIMKESETLAKKDASGVIGAVKIMPRALGNVDWTELLLALGTIIIIYGFKYITTAIPSKLVALVAMTAIAIFGGFPYQSIEKIPEGLPIPQWAIFTEFDFGNISPYIFTALTLALLGAIDSLLTSVVADNLTKTSHKPNQELIGQGIGNTIGALFGGIPGAGATIRTVVNINAGGKTKLSGMIAGLLLVVILVALGPIASKIPAAVLAGILITVGIGVVDYKGLKAIPYMPKAEIIILLTVLILSSVWNLVYAVGIGLIIASIIFMKQMGDLSAQAYKLQGFDSYDLLKGISVENTEVYEGGYVSTLVGPLFFGSSADFNSTFKNLPENSKRVIIQSKQMHYIDQSGVYALETVLRSLQEQQIDVFLIQLNKQPKNMLKQQQILPNIIPEEHLFNDLQSCIAWLDKNYKINNIKNA